MKIRSDFVSNSSSSSFLFYLDEIQSKKFLKLRKTKKPIFHSAIIDTTRIENLDLKNIMIALLQIPNNTFVEDVYLHHEIFHGSQFISIDLNKFTELYSQVKSKYTRKEMLNWIVAIGDCLWFETYTPEAVFVEQEKYCSKHNIDYKFTAEII